MYLSQKSSNVSNKTMRLIAYNNFEASKYHTFEQLNKQKVLNFTHDWIFTQRATKTLTIFVNNFLLNSMQYNLYVPYFLSAMSWS